MTQFGARGLTAFLRGAYARPDEPLLPDDLDEAVVVLRAERYDATTMTGWCGVCETRHTIRSSLGTSLLEMKQPYVLSEDQLDRCRVQTLLNRDNQTREAWGNRRMVLMYAPEELVRSTAPHVASQSSADNDALVVVEEDVPVVACSAIPGRPLPMRRRMTKKRASKHRTGSSKRLRIQRFPSRMRDVVFQHLRTRFMRDLARSLPRLATIC